MTEQNAGRILQPQVQIEMAVEMKSPCCASNVDEALRSIPDLVVKKVDLPTQTVIVEGNVAAEVVRKTVEQSTGLATVILGHGSGNQNLGAGVVAVAIGPSSARGVLRLLQTTPETSVIEGSLDGLPSSNRLFLAIHETGDLSKGCESCGPSYGTSEHTNGILGRLTLTTANDNSSNFRLTSQLKVADMIGRCVVIHDGDEKEVQQNQSQRLACGIVARSSGLFQNSKRFCACDGITIWEEKKKHND